MILQEIQAKLKAPKNQRNNFGGFNYRSCEDILEALKPVLAEYGAAILLSDEIVQAGARWYVKATATLKSKEGDVTVTAYAREAETRKCMDESQITGSASSYARKYALNGLFGIDDTKDADTMDNRDTAQKRPTHAEQTVANANLLEDKKFINLAQTMQELDDAMAAIKAKRGDKFASMRTQYVMAYKQRKAQIKGAAK